MEKLQKATPNLELSFSFVFMNMFSSTKNEERRDGHFIEFAHKDIKHLNIRVSNLSLESFSISIMKHLNESLKMIYNL